MAHRMWEISLVLVVAGLLHTNATETTLSSLVQGSSEKTSQQLLSTTASDSKLSAVPLPTGEIAATTSSLSTTQPSQSSTLNAPLVPHKSTLIPPEMTDSAISSATTTTQFTSAAPAPYTSDASDLGDPQTDFGSPTPNKREMEGIQRALDLLREKRSPDYGWENDTHMVILAKELSGARDPTDADSHVQVIQDLEYSLSIKQMEIEILSMLDKHHVLPKPVNSDRLARYVLALGSLCKDPKRFHGHDLVAALQHHEPAQVFNKSQEHVATQDRNPVSELQDQEFALTALAVCSSAAHVRKRQIRRLLDIASGVTDQSVETMAMVMLALRCIVTDHRHRHLQQFVRRPARGLAMLQGARGSFGSLRSTALAMQALQEMEPDAVGSWNRSAASKWILDRQRPDGGWTEEPIQDGQDPNIGIGLTADIILALGWKGLGAVRALQCDHVIRETSDNPSENGEPKLAAPVGLASSAEESEPRNVSYTYTLWLGTNVTESFSLSLISPRNTSFFRAMTQAADLDPRFGFEAREWPNGHYVHTLAGKREEPRGYNYWLLYRLPELPDPSNAPGNQLIAPVGVDELMVEEGEHYLYWYKKL